MGRTHDYYCSHCRIWWSPFDANSCVSCGADETECFYDLNHEAEEIDPETGQENWQVWAEGEDE